MRSAVASLAIALCLVPSAASAQACAGVTCSRHGECMEEGEDAYCFCDEGFQAVDLRCVRGRSPRQSDTASSSGARIVELALAQEGQALEGVGVGRVEEPGPLSRWVRPGGLWCSDFVSWVYRAAGVPFSSGYGGGWLLTNNVMIRRWYERRGAWVGHDSDEWATFRPRQGDYVRIHTREWGHSAIVRYVEGSTLFTIEGNASGHVRANRYPHWREHERIDGFGMTTMAAARVEATRASLSAARMR
jgi:hypothetical protein